MDNINPYLRAVRAISHMAGDVGLAWSVLLAFQTLVTAKHVPYWLLVMAIAFPFIAALGAKVTGNMFGILLELVEQAQLRVPETDALSTSMREVSQEVRARQSTAGAPPSYLDAAT